MLKKILLVLAVLLAGFLVVAAFQPEAYAVTRSATIAAPAPAVFAQVNNLHAWQAWSPWAKLDPAAKYSYAGPAEGKDAAMSWAGNMDVGAGTMTITESRPAELVRFRLDFTEPFADTCASEFNFKSAGNQTIVTWTMSGKNSNVLKKAMCMVMNMDKMLGGQFEQGLAQLKVIAEKPAVR